MNDDDLIRRGDVIAILSAASRTAQKTIDAIAALPTAQVTVKPLEWEPIGNMFHAFDPLFSVMAISENPNAYDDERAARIRSALTVTTYDPADVQALRRMEAERKF